MYVGIFYDIYILQKFFNFKFLNLINLLYTKSLHNYLCFIILLWYELAGKNPVTREKLAHCTYFLVYFTYIVYILLITVYHKVGNKLINLPDTLLFKPEYDKDKH